MPIPGLGVRAFPLPHGRAIATPTPRHTSDLRPSLLQVQMLPAPGWELRSTCRNPTPSPACAGTAPSSAPRQEMASAAQQEAHGLWRLAPSWHFSDRWGPCQGVSPRWGRGRAPRSCRPPKQRFSQWGLWTSSISIPREGDCSRVANSQAPPRICNIRDCGWASTLGFNKPSSVLTPLSAPSGVRTTGMGSS